MSEQRLLTDAEIAAIADLHATAQALSEGERMPIVTWVKLLQKEHAEMPRLLADLERCHAWLRRLMEAWDSASCDYNFAEKSEVVLNEARVALEDKSC